MEAINQEENPAEVLKKQINNFTLQEVFQSYKPPSVTYIAKLQSK